MLSCCVAPPRHRCHLLHTRRAMPQLTLNFGDIIPIPERCLWEQFDDEQKQILIEALARLLLKATQGNEKGEEIVDD
jgi:hypothetical protein